MEPYLQTGSAPFLQFSSYREKQRQNSEKIKTPRVHLFSDSIFFFAFRDSVSQKEEIACRPACDQFQSIWQCYK